MTIESREGLMILKVDIDEKISNLYSSNISINLVNKNVSYLKGDSIIQNSECRVDSKEIEELLKNYITYWKPEYIDDSVIDGRIIEILVYTDKEVTKYYFKNSFPDDYDEFIRVLKGKVGIHE